MSHDENNIRGLFHVHDFQGQVWEFGDRAFSVAGPVVWNSLPAAVRHADSLHSLKRRLKSHFLACVLMTDSVMPFRSGFAHEGH